jgi:hypothetical protein
MLFSSLGVTKEEWRLNEGNLGEGIWLMDFIILHKIKKKENSCNFC